MTDQRTVSDVVMPGSYARRAEDRLRPERADEGYHDPT
ncbi:hypothetical protein BJ964_009183 [Actinoplanes lobatus]|uniref:Uncharacterized protein n=1 Tax=Actinoplanes lobatus TaxID=113568 RepID=A0A7W7HQZ2_9ACTN|nr:hypothetical protein [Actinoplanes lobatus]